MVHLEVAIYRGRVEGAPPTVFLTGGPGGGAVEELARAYAFVIDPLLDSGDFVVFDQRGTGYSRPNLECPEFVTVVEADLEKGFSPEEMAEEYPRAMRRCRDRLTALGADLDAYTSAANAADVKELVEVLGYERVNLYGASYGTRLALTVMRDHPGVVNSVVLDAVEPIEAPMYNGHPASVDRLLNKLFAGCEADPACRAAYPDLEGRYYALVERLNESPVELWTKSIGNKMYQVQFDGTWLTETVFFSAYSSDLIRYLPRVISNAYHGNYELLSWIAGATSNPNTDVSIGMMLSVNCHEEVFATTPEELVAAYAAYPHIESVSYDAVFGSPSNLFTICEEWGAAPFEALEGEPVASDVPALVLVGEYDPVTPPWYASQVAERLSRSYYYEFPGEGHVVGLGQSPCAQEIVVDFLEDPETPPDAACMDELSGPDFVE
jgi:pimeloyl-ACP methyl ester carboxylesterase